VVADAACRGGSGVGLAIVLVAGAKRKRASMHRIAGVHQILEANLIIWLELL
jgi:hypothetical protein